MRSAVISPLASGAGHVAGGTAANLFAGQNLSDAFYNSFDGIGKSIAIGTAIGVSATVATCYANGISPLSGKSIQPPARIVTPDGVVLPEGAEIPNNLIDNPYYPGKGSYGIIDQNGNFQEIVRIDQGTPPGFKGPNESHFHLNNKKHIFDASKWPWWKK